MNDTSPPTPLDSDLAQLRAKVDATTNRIAKLRPAKVKIDAEFSSLLFVRPWARPPGQPIEPREYFSYGPAYEGQNAFQAVHKRLSGIVNNGYERWFIFYVEDCFDPPMYAVNGQSFEDAYEEFLDQCEHLIKVEETDLKDYLRDNPPSPHVGADIYVDRLKWNNHGTPVDDEAVRGFEVKLVEAKA